MTGLEKNLRRLFRPNGKTLWVALDHPQFCGPMPGLENPIQTIGRILLAPHDGMILNPGIFRLLPTEAYQKRLVMRVSVGGTCFSDYSKVHPVVVDPVQALCEGADAVIMMLILGSQDALAMESVRRHIEAYHRYAIPVVVEVMSEDYTLNNDFQHAVSYTHLRAHETPEHLVCRPRLEKKKKKDGEPHHTPHRPIHQRTGANCPHCLL